MITALRVRPEVLAFLADCKREPTSDTPRLILADWLEDHGDEVDRARADLIRIQCARGRYSGSVALESESRERDLVNQYGPSWIKGLGIPLLEWRCERGLLEVSVQANRLGQLPKSALDSEAWAWVNALTVYESRRQQDRVWTFPSVIRHLTELNLFDSYLRPSALRTLTENPEANQLRRLTLSYNALCDEGALILASAPHLRQLQTLVANCCLIGYQGALALLTAPGLRCLRYLNLVGNPISPAMCKELRQRCPMRLHLEV